MTVELQETKVCRGEVTEMGKTDQKQEKRLRFPVSNKKKPFLAARELPLLFKAKQIFFLIETRQHLVQYTFIMFGVKNPFL